jgi:hypothetical protein
MCQISGDFDTENAYRKPPVILQDNTEAAPVTRAHNERLVLEDSDQSQGREFLGGFQ